MVAVDALLERARTAAGFLAGVFFRLVDFFVVDAVFFFDTAFLVATFLVDAVPFAPAFLPALVLARFLVAAFFVPVFLAFDFLLDAAEALFLLVLFLLLVDFFLLAAFFVTADFFLLDFLVLVPVDFRADFFFDAPAVRFVDVFFFDVVAVLERLAGRALTAPRFEPDVDFFLAAAFFFGIAPASKRFFQEAGIIQMRKARESPISCGFTKVRAGASGRSGRESDGRFRAPCGGLMIGDNRGVNAAPDVEFGGDPKEPGLEQADEIAEDLIRDGFMEGADRAEGCYVEFQGLKLDAGRFRDVFEQNAREVRLAGLRANAGEFRDADSKRVIAFRARIRKAFEKLAGSHWLGL